MPEISFRKEALERLTSPDQLDERVTQAPLRGWLSLVAISILLAFLAVWTIFAQVPIKIKASGVFLLSGPVFVASGVARTKLVAWKVNTGDEIKAGQLIAVLEDEELRDQLALEKATLDKLNSHHEKWKEIQRNANSRWQKVLESSSRDLKAAIQRLERSQSGNLDRIRYELERTDLEIKRITRESEKDTADLDRQLAVSESQRRIQFLQEKYEAHTQIKAEKDGILLQIAALPPAMIEMGETIAILSPLGNPKKDMFAVAFIKPLDASTVMPGQRVEIRVPNYHAEETGLLIGKVRSVSATSLSEKAINSLIPIPGLASQILDQDHAPHYVIVDLIPDPQSPTGYQWSGFDPKKTLAPGTSFDAMIVLTTVRPIEYLWPMSRDFI